MGSKITLSIDIQVPMKAVWELWTKPDHIKEWNNVDETWHTPEVRVDLKDRGKFLYRMETKDGQQGFDHKGTFDKVLPHRHIECTLEDGRKTVNTFTELGESTRITETFEPEDRTPVDIQENFCLQILQNFKGYAESRKLGV